jgi:hypothetical protein
MRDPQSIAVDDDSRFIPIWSIVAASLAFLLVEYYFWIIAPQSRHHEGPALGLRVYFNLSWGLLASLYCLMLGYISKDAPRRGMNTRFWMLVCLVMPGGIGAVLYFLLRQPQVSRCPGCGTHVQNDFHFCPQCNRQLSTSCGNCHLSVLPGDQYCTRCGHELANGHAPARLHIVEP